MPLFILIVLVFFTYQLRVNIPFENLAYTLVPTLNPQLQALLIQNILFQNFNFHFFTSPTVGDLFCFHEYIDAVTFNRTTSVACDVNS